MVVLNLKLDFLPPLAPHSQDRFFVGVRLKLLDGHPCQVYGFGANDKIILLRLEHIPNIKVLVGRIILARWNFVYIDIKISSLIRLTGSPDSSSASRLQRRYQSPHHYAHQVEATYSACDGE